MNRSELSRLLAKCLAYLACGKQAEADKHARALVDALRSLGVDV